MSLSDIKNYAHRLAWYLTYGRFPDGSIDHINRVRTDNRLANLREATHSQNCANCSVRAHSKSGIKGVTKRVSKYSARIVVEGKRYSLGSFATPEEALDAWVEASRRMRGDFTRVI